MDIEVNKPAYFLPELDKLRLVLLFFSIVYTFGVHPALGDIGNLIFSFAPPAFFVISGYLVLRDSQNIEKRILNAIKRTAVCFFILVAVYLAGSYLVSQSTTVAALTSKKFWFDFLVLNVWSLPIGSTVWYVQALLYAYIIIYVLYKLKLLRFDLIIALICLAITLVTGELSALVKFNFFGHTYIGGNFLTRALPYILIGRFIHRRTDLFAGFRRKLHIIIAVAGIVLAVGEYYLLVHFRVCGYCGHMIGMGITAIALCLAGFYLKGNRFRTAAFMLLSRYELMIPYYICSPIYCGVRLFLMYHPGEFTSQISTFAGLITTALSFTVLLIYALIKLVITLIKTHIKTGSDEKSTPSTQE